MSELLRAISAIVAAHSVSVVYLDLRTGERVEHRAGEKMHAASTMKLAVLITAHRLAAAGKLDLDGQVVVENRFESLADGSPFAVDAKDDDDPWMYEQLGRTLSFRTLLERMIVRSSNLATNLVMRRVPAAEVRRACEALGAPGMNVLRGVEDGKAHERGLDNTTTAQALARLLAVVARGETAGAAEIASVLRRQELNEGIPSALPAGTRVAHKTGSITAHFHDAAIVEPEGGNPYVLVVMTRGFEREAEAVATVKEISRTVWRHALDARRQRH